MTSNKHNYKFLIINYRMPYIIMSPSIISYIDNADELLKIKRHLLRSSLTRTIKS